MAGAVLVLGYTRNTDPKTVKREQGEAPAGSWTSVFFHKKKKLGTVLLSGKGADLTPPRPVVALHVK